MTKGNKPAYFVKFEKKLKKNKKKFAIKKISCIFALTNQKKI